MMMAPAPLGNLDRGLALLPAYAIDHTQLSPSLTCLAGKSELMGSQYREVQVSVRVPTRPTNQQGGVCLKGSVDQLHTDGHHLSRQSQAVGQGPTARW